jgi:hypothetical protein
MNKREALYLVAGALLAALPARIVPALGAPGEPHARTEPASVEALLRAFVDDFRADPFADREVTFGIRVKDAEPSDWHVYVAGRVGDDEEATVELAQGLPLDPAPFYVTDVATLTAIHAGELASLTAMGKAFSTDFAPLDIERMPGYASTPEMGETMTGLNFHFWTRGTPELIRLGAGATTRVLHGGSAILLYYHPGFRSGFFRIEPGQHVNEDPLMQVNTFPSMLVATKGALHCRIGGRELVLEEQVAVLIPAGVSHEFWVEEGEEPGEGILLMFGAGA